MVNELIDLCKGKEVYIQTHNFPDPDAISSAFGLQRLLKKFNIKSTICHEGKIDKLSSTKMLTQLNIEMKPYDEIKDTMKETDMIILVDCQKNNGNTTDLIGDEVAAIDHHPTFKEIDYQYKDVRITGSCASIIASYYDNLGIDIEVDVATALLYGLRMDTLQLSRGVTMFDVDMYRYLFQHHSADLLNFLERNNMEFDDLRAYGVAVENIRVYGNVAFSYLNFFCPDGLVATLADFILSLEEVEVAIIYSYRENGYKFSVRSEIDDVHAGYLAQLALKDIGNGGGHATMAGGFVVKENLDKLGNYVFDSVQRIFMDVIDNKKEELINRD